MYNELNFTVPGQPRGKGRPRFYNGHAYTDKATRKYENLIAKECGYRMTELGLEPFSGFVSVFITAYRLIPKNSKHKENGHCAVKPDIDNIAKAVIDGMQKGGVFKDDNQVVRLEAEKRWSENPRVYVRVEEHDE